MLLHPLLVARGYRVRGLIRKPEQADDLRQAGAEPVLCDLETKTDISEFVGQADAVVFAAGAGPGSGAERKWTVDRDGAVKLILSAEKNNIRRYVLVSAMNLEMPRGSEVFQVYLKAKAESEAALRESGLDWTIVRPGSLTDEPGTGHVAIAPELPKGDIPRADVAAVLAEVLDTPKTTGLHFDLTSGKQPVREAVEELSFQID